MLLIHLCYAVVTLINNQLLLLKIRAVPLTKNIGDGNIFQILKKRWWKYLLLGFVDVEANYTVVKAYQYTTLTSVQVSRKKCPI